MSGLTPGLTWMPHRIARRFFTSARHTGPAVAPKRGRKFQNEVPTARWSRDVFRWLAARQPEPWPAWVDKAEARPAPPARVDGEALRVTFVNHATVLLQTAGLNILTDPVWSKRVGPFSWLGAARVREPGVAFEALPRIDLVLLSHDHYDHLDVATVKRLMQRDKPRLITGLGVDRTLAIDGILGAEALDWWQSRTVGPGVRATFTPSRHFSGRGLSDQDSTLWGAFVLETPAGLVYFAGDTGYGPHFAEVRRRFGPVACALLPVGCYEPRWFMREFHMAPADAVQAHVDLDARFSIGIHHGTFRLGDEAIDRPARDLGEALAAAGLPASCFSLLEFGAAAQVSPTHAFHAS